MQVGGSALAPAGSSQALSRTESPSRLPCGSRQGWGCWGCHPGSPCCWHKAQCVLPVPLLAPTPAGAAQGALGGTHGMGMINLGLWGKAQPHRDDPPPFILTHPWGCGWVWGESCPVWGF